MIKNFVIPLEKDELLRSQPGQYSVEEIIPVNALPKALEASRSALNDNGVHAIVEHFQTFFSVIVHGNKVELPIISRAFNRVMKALEILVDDLEKLFDHGQELGADQRLLYLCANKMLAYLLSWFIRFLNEKAQSQSDQAQNIGKRKAAIKKSDFEEQWDSDRQKTFELIYRWLQVPLHQIWQPPIVEDQFIKCLTQVLYKSLERSVDNKEKQIRQTIFEILGTLVTKYNHGTICVVKLIQLVKLYEALALPVAAGVIHMVTECGCQGMVKEIIKEIEHNEPGEVDSRNISIFLENVAASRPDLIIPVLDNITDHLADEHYTMRNCAIGVLTAVIQKSLTGEDLTPKEKEHRDECLKYLLTHMLDSNAYVRSKVLQAWQELCCEGAIPLIWQKKLLTATVKRAADKSAIVRKQALQLLRALLESNPYAARFNKDELKKMLEAETMKLKELQTNVASESKRGDNERKEIWKALLPDIRSAIKKVLNNDKIHDNAKEDEEIDPNTVFEKIRQLLLNEEVNEAVAYLWKVCTLLKEAPDMTNLSSEAKEECLFLFLLKIFMDSESTDQQQKNQSRQSPEPEHKKAQKDLESCKRVVNYLKSCLNFSDEFERAIPLLKVLLFKSITDVVETCALLEVAYKFGLAGAAAVVRQAMFLIFSEEQSVRTAVAKLYKEIYHSFDQKSGRQTAVTLATRLIDLMKELEPGQSPALQELMVTWYKKEELNAETLQVLWEKFTMKLPGTEPLDSRTALMLITMLADEESRIITENLNTLVQEGFGTRAKNDLLLARDTCRALMKIKQNDLDIKKSPLRYSNDHEMFKAITNLLTDHFMQRDAGAYVSFATDAINVIFHLANQPDRLVKDVLINISNQGNFCHNGSTGSTSVPPYLLSRFLYVVGHISIGIMVHLDTSVYKELKRRNALREMKKGNKANRQSKNTTIVSTPSSASASTIRRVREASIAQEDNGEEALEGAADDTDAEIINNVLEHEILTGDGLLSRYSSFVVDICKHPERHASEDVQASAALALGKMMTVSSVFCEMQLQLFVTILEKSPYPGVRSNILVGLRDLINRFPNLIEPWTKHIYSRLRDKDKDVRYNCVRTLSDLILREMIRVKGQVSELALCIVDEDPEIRKDTKQLFKDLSLKGNALYNVMPDILSRLSDPALNLEEDSFQEILKYILSLIQKEKHVDTIIDRLCMRFRLANTERQWRDLSYCLSLLQFSAKNIRQLIEHLPLLKDKLHHKDVLRALRHIIDQAKKKPLAKEACVELEELIKKLLEDDDNASEVTDSQLMPPPTAKPVRRKKLTRRSKHKNSSDEEDDDDDEDIATLRTPQGKLGRQRPQTARRSKNKTRSETDSSDDERERSDSSGKQDTRKTQRKKSRDPFADASPSPVPKKNKLTKLTQETRRSARLSNSSTRK